MKLKFILMNLNLTRMTKKIMDGEMGKEGMILFNITDDVSSMTEID